jgi:HEAT repeat protein
MTDVLYQALKDRDPQVRVQAAKGLWRRVKLERVVVPIVQPLLGERDPLVRRTAVEVLSELKGEGNRVVPLLCAALDDRVADVRLTALEALVRLGKDDEPLLLREAKNKSPRVRAGVATALGRRPGAEALKALTLLERDEDRLVRTAAVTALRRHFRNKG